MEFGFVVGFFDFLCEVDVSIFVLCFGGECEFVWLNDKNVLVIFVDVVWVVIVFRRVDYVLEYRGVIIMLVDVSFFVRGGVWGM